MVAEATCVGGRRASGWARGTDSDGTTATIVVAGATRLIKDAAEPGVLAPARAFDPAEFLNSLPGVSWAVTD